MQNLTYWLLTKQFSTFASATVYADAAVLNCLGNNEESPEMKRLLTFGTKEQKHYFIIYTKTSKGGGKSKGGKCPPLIKPWYESHSSCT